MSATQTHLPNPKKLTGKRRIAVLHKRIRSISSKGMTTGIRYKHLCDYRAELIKLQEVR